MAATPKLDELKQARGSNQLHHCFKFLFVQEWIENEGLITYLGQKCADFQANIEKRAELVQEAQSFGLFHDVATDGSECMVETQQRDQQILAGLSSVLDLARVGRLEKQRHVGLMQLKD